MGEGRHAHATERTSGTDTGTEVWRFKSGHGPVRSHVLAADGSSAH
jgi:hypothetical protein